MEHSAPIEDQSSRLLAKAKEELREPSTPVKHHKHLHQKEAKMDSTSIAQIV